MTPNSIDAYHTVYGQWDDVMDDQFMVFWHPYGSFATIFLFSGFDYGGGISKVVHISANKTRRILSSFTSAYETKKAFNNLDKDSTNVA